MNVPAERGSPSRLWVRRHCLSVLLVLSACSNQEEDLREDATRKVCDGSSSIRLAVQAMPGRVDPDGSAVQVENGRQFLFVDGGCRYWVQTHLSSTAVHTGVLDANQEEALTRGLRYRSWEWLKGNWQGEQSYKDWGAIYFWDASHTVACHDGCQMPTTPVGFRDVLAYWDEKNVVDTLWKAGTPVQGGGVRFLMVAATTSTPTPLDWPLEQPAEDFLVPVDEVFSLRPGDSRLVDKPDEVQKLRDLRAAYQARPDLVNYTAGKLPIRGVGKPPVYGLLMRDTLPFEDERGLVRPPSGNFQASP